MSNAVFQGWRSPANRLGFAVFSLFVVAALLTPVSLAAQTANPLLEMLKSPNADTRARAAREVAHPSSLAPTRGRVRPTPASQ